MQLLSSDTRTLKHPGPAETSPCLATQHTCNGPASIFHLMPHSVAAAVSKTSTTWCHQHQVTQGPTYHHKMYCTQIQNLLKTLHQRRHVVWHTAPGPHPLHTHPPVTTSSAAALPASTPAWPTSPTCPAASARPSDAPAATPLTASPAALPAAMMPSCCSACCCAVAAVALAAAVVASAAADTAWAA